MHYVDADDDVVVVVATCIDLDETNDDIADGFNTNPVAVFVCVLPFNVNAYLGPNEFMLVVAVIVLLTVLKLIKQHLMLLRQ